MQAPLVASVGGGFEGALGAAEQTVAEVKKTVATMQGLVAGGVDQREVDDLEKVLAGRVEAASARMEGERERAIALEKAAVGLRDDYLAQMKELGAAVARMEAKQEEESRRAAVLDSKESELAEYRARAREMAKAVIAVGEAARRFGELGVGSRGLTGGAASEVKAGGGVAAPKIGLGVMSEAEIQTIKQENADRRSLQIAKDRNFAEDLLAREQALVERIVAAPGPAWVPAEVSSGRRALRLPALSRRGRTPF